MNNLSALDSLESCTTHPVSGFSRFVAVLVLLFLTISTAFAQPPLPSGDCGRNVLEFEAGYLSTIVNGLPISSQGSGTWEAWVKKDNWAAGQPEFTLFSNAYAYPNAKAFYVSLHPAVGLHFRSGYEGGGYAAYPTTMQYEENSWHHFAATWSEDESHITIAIYVDGDSITSTETTAKFGLESGFYFGGSPAHPAFAPGSMADIRLWDGAKTEAEISASLGSTLIGDEAGLIGYWPLDDVTGSSTATNLVAGGSAATLVSMSPSSAWVTNHSFNITSDTEVKSGSTTDFGTQMTGMSSEARVFTIINDGTSTLDFQGNPISQLMGTDADQFILDLTGTSGSLAAGATTTFSVSFSPTTEGTKTASISFTNVESCEDPYTINLSGIGSTLSGSISIDSHVSIYDGSDGQLTVSSAGGTGPYTYLWSNGATSATVEGLSAGAYSVSIADNVGASVVRSATITQPDELIVTLEVNAHVSTVGGNDGAVTASVAGGVAPYSYLWNNDEITAGITDLISGEYAVTVTDMNGAIASESITVTQPKPVSAYIQVVTEPGFNGNYGELSAYAHHGAPPYSYLWSTGATTQVISGLSTGTYSVTITDGYDMESVASVTFKSATIEYSGSFSEASANDGSVLGSLNVSLFGDMFSESDDILDENEVTVTGVPAGMNHDFEISERHAVGEIWDTLMGFSNSNGYWSDLTYGNERYVAVSSNYYDYGVMISYDGMRWQGVDNTYDSWKAITFGDSLFVAVSEYGYVTRSYDGINWSETYTDDLTFSDVVFGNGLFVAVASSYDYESIMVSPDGVTWEAPTDYSNDRWAAVSYGAGMFIAISADGQPMTSPDGWEWSLEETTTIENVSNIAYGNGLFVVTTSSGEIWTSSDGSSWSQRMDVSDVLSAITYGQGEFVAVTDNDVDNLIYKSSNGIDWSTVDLGSVGFNTIAFGKGRFIAMGDYQSSPGWIITSKLGSTATLSFTGNATAHQDADDISDIQFEFSDAAFTNVEAADVINAVGSSGVGVDFNDNPQMVYSGVGFRATGAGSVEGRIVVTLNGENFQDDDEDGLLDINDEVIISNIPEVLTPKLSITSQNQQGLDWTDGTDTSISGTYTAAAYGNGTYVALNYNSTDYIYSTDGVNWVEAELNYGGWWDVTYANGLFVAVGSAENGYVMTSTDGINWDYQEVYGDWQGVTYAEGRFVVVGDDAAMHSSDGQNWIVNSEVPSAEWYAVTYGNGKFVAVSPYSPGVMISEDGASWLSGSSDIFDDGGLEDITYGNGLFVGLGGYGDDVYTSADGFIWTAHEIDYGNWNWITYGGGQFIIVGENYYDDAILRSADGQSWSGTNNAVDIDLNVVLYAEGSFLVFTDNSNQWLLKSEATAATVQLTLSGSGLNTSDNTDDITFEFADHAFANIAAANVINATGPASSGLGLTFHPKTASITYAGEGFTEAVANDGSVDGAIKIILSGDHFANDDEDNFLEVGTKVVVNNIPEGLTPSLAITESSALGVTWTSPFPEGTAQYKSVAYGNGIYVAMADYGTNKLITSADGINWTPSEAQDAENWASVAFGNGIFVALPYYASHLAYTSEDGVNWTARAPSSEQGWIDITFGNGRFMAIRPNGTDRVMTSLDGIHWTLTSGDDNVGDFIGFGNGLFVSGSYSEDIATSSDGINWTPQELSNSEGYYFGINDVAYGNGLFVLVGDYSEESGIENDYRVLTSPDAVTWTPRSVDMSDWFAVDYGGGLFVAVAYNGTNRVMTSEDGINWTVQSDAPLSAWDDVIYGSDGFVAVANGGEQRVMTGFQTAEATLTLTGNAEAHQSTHNVSDITFEFADAAFTNSLAVNVLNATGPASSGLGVEFESNPPANDDCANAQVLSVYEPGEGTATAGSTEFAVPNAESSPCTEESNIKDLWYSFNSGESGQVIFTVEAGETTAIAGAVYTACGEIYQIESPFGDFPACALDQSELLLLTLSPNTDYLLQVWSPGGAVGDFTVLLEANAPPVIDPIADKTMDEETEIEFTVTATDDFLPFGNIEFVLHGDLVDLGMSIDSESGEFSWIPSEDQGGVYEVVVYALDYLSEYTYTFSYSSDTFNITVNEVNVAPVLDAVEDQTATVAEALGFMISGSDTDLPSNVLTYSLDAVSQGKGMSVNSATGEFNWLPTTTDAGTSNAVTVTLSDGSLTDELSFSINVEKLSQTVTFGELEDKTFGDEAFDLTVTASSELTVTFTSSDETVASVSGSTVTILGAGTATITASQAGNDNYTAALDVAQSLTIEKATQTIGFEALADKTFGDEAFDLTATASSELTVTFTSSDETVASVSGSTVTIMGAGTATITASQAGNDNYNAAVDVEQSLTIEKATQTISFEALANKTYGNVPFDLTATGGASGNAVTFTSSDETVASVSGSTVTIMGAGTATITASQAGNDNYTAALDVAQSLTIEKATQTISFEALASKTYGAQAFDLAATGGAGGNAVTFTSSDETIASVTGSTVTILGAGTVTITASQAGNTNYQAATEVEQTLTVNQAAQTISFEALSSKTYGNAPFDLTATGGASGNAVTFTSSDETVASVSGSTVTILGAGTATITASQAGNDNYNAALDVAQRLTIEKATQTISFEALADKTYGNAPFDLIATGGASGNAVTFTSSDETVASVTGSTVTILGAGTVTITASQAGNTNYQAATEVEQALTVNQASQTISFEALSSKTYGNAPFDLIATGGASGNAVTFTSSDETIASVTGSTVTILGAGTATITASQAGDDNYGVPSNVSQDLIIGKASLRVSAGDVSRVYGVVNPVFIIGYQGFIGDDSEADLEAVPSASTPAMQTSDVGTYAITVSGGADENYVFDYAEGTLTINKAMATITLTDLSQTADGTAKSPTVTTDPAALNYSITFDGSSALPTQAGTYAVEVEVLETNYEGSASGSFVLTKTVALGALLPVNEVKIYPNPATERLTVSGDDGLVVKIYDISGVLQLEHKTNQTIAVDRLPSGVYLIQVSAPNGRMVSRQRVVKY